MLTFMRISAINSFLKKFAQVGVKFLEKSTKPGLPYARSYVAQKQSLNWSTNHFMVIVL